ncbi:MAG: toprim domain-containing protein, partial [Anaerolineales bacterium]|nr:toprim domain-containing protein [Anaerolineales bacterium]
MFPIRDRNGQVIGFGARTLTGDEPKYLNSPQTPLFDKSATLYGLDLAKDAIRQHNLAVIVEGYMDVIGAHQAGFCNVIASLGTALTEKQLGLLKRLTNRYALALDPDAAGQEATKRGLEVARGALDRKTGIAILGAGKIILTEKIEGELLAISMPPGKDPDELIHEDPKRWVDLTSHPEPLVDFYFRVWTQDLDLRTAVGKSTAVNRLLPIIQEIKDKVGRSHYTQRLARLLQIAEDPLLEQIERQEKGLRVPLRVVGNRVATAVAGNLSRAEYFLTLALHTPEHLPRVAFLEPDDFVDAETRAFFLALREFGSAADFFDHDAF